MTTPQYQVWVHTGSQPLAGTDSNVYIMLYGTQGRTDWILLPAEDAFAFEENAVDKFLLDLPDLGDPTRVCLSHDESVDSGWYVNNVRIEGSDGRTWTFTFNSWIGEEEAGRRVVCADV